MNPILVLAPVAALFMITVLAIGKWSNAEEKLAKFIKCYGESIVESNDYYYALLDILSDTEADWAMESQALNRHLLAHIKLTHESETAYGKLFESYEALQKSHNELQDDYRKLYRPRCPKCNRFMKDGKCNNPKCSKIDLSNLPETFDAETAGRVIEAGGYVDWGNTAGTHYHCLSDKKDGSVCISRIDEKLNKKRVWHSVSSFVERHKNETFRQVTPVFLKKPGKPKEIETKPLLADAPFEGLEGVKVCDPILFSDGVIRMVVIIDRITALPHAIKISPAICVDHSGSSYFNIKDGKHWENKTTIRAIRIANESDLEIYGGSND